MKKKKARKPKTAPSPKVAKGTQILGHVFTPYVQTQVPAKLAEDVCEALKQMILSDYYSRFCHAENDEENQ